MVLKSMSLNNVSSLLNFYNLRTPFTHSFPFHFPELFQNKIVQALDTLPLPSVQVSESIYVTCCKCYSIGKFVWLHFD